VKQQRSYRTFVHKDAVFRISCASFDVVTDEIRRQRSILEEYIATYPRFKTSFAPLSVPDSAPEIVKRMAEASQVVGVGPMASVAGVMASVAAEKALAAGDEDVIIDNGGDIFAVVSEPLIISVFSGVNSAGNNLGFRIVPAQTPLSICSSSGKMGHSTSLGKCDLAVTVSKDAAIADAAATAAANAVKGQQDISKTAESIAGLPGVDGVLIVQDTRFGMAGGLPPLIKIN